MRNVLNVYLFCLLVTITGVTAVAQSDNSIWMSIPNQSLSSKQALAQRNMPSQFQAYRMADPLELNRVLQAAPDRFSAEAKETKVEITLPLPNGQMEGFRILHSPLLQSRLAAAYPELKTFTAISVNKPAVTAKIEMTPKGLFAMILGHDQGTIFINPYEIADQTYYSFYKKDGHNVDQAFRCELEESGLDDFPKPTSDTAAKSGDCKLRQYRLALACTGEYAQLQDDGDDSNGDIIADVLATMVVTIDRANGIFEKEVGVTMVIIDENEEIIFTDPENDPYTNESVNVLINENVPVCTNVIGSANYDIGHVFSRGGGGIAFIASPCSGNKARGVSGQRGQIGNLFDIGTVYHELGHQYGARHTHNNDCSSSASSSYEPGSGSTIMSYGGICAPLVQTFRDDYFHAKSLEQIGAFVTGDGNSCATILNTENNAPSADAGVNYTIPISTPFVLTGVGSDTDDDPITYGWEQWDKEEAPMPPLSTSTEGPSFRSFPPSPAPQRYFPNLNILLGLDPNTWEVLPAVSRDLNFRLVVRDDNGAYGCTDESDMTVSAVATAGPFVLTSPTAATSWNVGDTETITWDVANTDAVPISCENVDILLSTDGGFTYPNVLAISVPNDGSHTITVPNLSSAQVRIMVRCTDNVFFAISEEDIAIGFSLVCVELNSTDIPVTIPAAGTPTITSSLNVSFEEELTAIKVINLTGTHSYVGDLQFKLVAPAGEEVLLIDQRCAALADFDLALDDSGQVLSCPYNDGQIATPVEDLASLVGTSTLGDWQLVISDLASSDGGQLISWGLEICYAENLVSSTDLLRENVSLQLAPNPVGQQLAISLVSTASLEGELQVVNAVGQILTQIPIESSGRYDHQLQVGHLPAGLYFIRVADKRGDQLVKRFVKQ